jgi:hypothetical protein
MAETVTAAEEEEEGDAGAIVRVDASGAMANPRGFCVWVGTGEGKMRNTDI